MELTWFSRVLIYSLLFLSGAAGLIYQVVWHRYLGILLGAQAKATAIILAIFLGGISFGYAAFGRWSRTKRWNMLTAYVLVELGLAQWAGIFPTLFGFCFNHMSALYRVMGVDNSLVDFGIAILLLGPPTFLMGGTLPLLTQGLSRDLREASRTHALIYGFNTLGACFGCLMAGYFLIPVLGFEFASYSGSAINLLVALLAYWFFARKVEVSVAAVEVQSITELNLENPGGSPKTLGLWVIGFLSGFYLITLETVLIRLMGLATGSSNYNFTLIVAIFIFALGIGSVAARGISNYRFRHLVRNQLLVTLLLCAVYLSGNYWAWGGHVLRSFLRDIPQNFYVYQIMLASCLFAMLLIPLAFSGLTLPLCFHLVKEGRGNLGEKVGQLYSLNAVGCVIGALLGGYIALNVVELDQLFKICILCCLFTALVACYLFRREEMATTRQLAGPCLTAGIALCAVILTPYWNRDSFVQPFRHSSPIEDVTFRGPLSFANYLTRSTKLIYWKDGPNTSLGIGSNKHEGKEMSRTVFVNGKSDGNTRGDFFTALVLAHIPALLTPKIDNALVIGLGTGITIGALSQYPEVKNIDVAEISNFSIKRADYFDNFNHQVSTSSKIKFHEMDAFRFLQGTANKFDLVVSEPSNPWVAGIENLYSDEFYEIVLSRLAEKGTFVQWIHTYSFNDDLMRLVMSTITKRFPYVSIFQLKGGDMAVLCRRSPLGDEEVRTASERFNSQEWLRKSLFEAGIERIETVFALEVAPHPLPRIMGHGQPIHTLTSPLLSNGAAKAFFVGSSARVQLLRRQYKQYLSILNSGVLARWLGSRSLSMNSLTSMRSSFCDQYMSKTNYLCEEVLAMTKFLDNGFSSGTFYDEVVSSRDIANLSIFHENFQKVFTEKELQKVFTMFDTYKKVASPIAHLPLRTFTTPLNRCLQQEGKNPGALYGECLLQKLLVVENLEPESTEFLPTISTYQSWFHGLEKSSPNYAKFEEASQILKHMQR